MASAKTAALFRPFCFSRGLCFFSCGTGFFFAGFPPFCELIRSTPRRGVLWRTQLLFPPCDFPFLWCSRRRAFCTSAAATPSSPQLVLDYVLLSDPPGNFSSKGPVRSGIPFCRSVLGSFLFFPLCGSALRVSSPPPLPRPPARRHVPRSSTSPPASVRQHFRTLPFFQSGFIAPVFS